MYLVTGANGQLGQALRLYLPKDTIYADKNTLDITDRDAVQGFIKVYHPSAVINCAVLRV